MKSTWYALGTHRFHMCVIYCHICVHTCYEIRKLTMLVFMRISYCWAQNNGGAWGPGWPFLLENYETHGTCMNNYETNMKSTSSKCLTSTCHRFVMCSCILCSYFVSYVFSYFLECHNLTCLHTKANYNS